MTATLHPFTLLFASIFTSNILLANFLGMCSFIAISREPKSAFGLGFAVTVVMTVCGAFSYFALRYIIMPLGLEYLSFILFIILIAAVVQVLEMILERVAPALYMTLGIFLPLVTVNCAILGVVLFMQIRQYTFLQTLAFCAGSGLGWWLAIVLLAAIRQRIENNPMPAGLKGKGITIITIGFMAMAFMGFSGMIPVQ